MRAKIIISIVVTTVGLSACGSEGGKSTGCKKPTEDVVYLTPIDCKQRPKDNSSQQVLTIVPQLKEIYVSEGFNAFDPKCTRSYTYSWETGILTVRRCGDESKDPYVQDKIEVSLKLDLENKDHKNAIEAIEEITFQNTEPKQDDLRGYDGPIGTGILLTRKDGTQERYVYSAQMKTDAGRVVSFGQAFQMLEILFPKQK